MSIIEDLTGGIESIFGSLGNIQDGAASLFNDWEDYWQKDQEEAQQAAFSQGGQAGVSSFSGGTAPLNNNIIIYGGLGLLSVVAVSLLMGD